MRKLLSEKRNLENYIAAFATRSYPNISKALKNNTATYNSALEFIYNPPSDCKIMQICPPQRLSTKRATTNLNTMKADYQIGMNCGEEFLEKIL